MNPFKDLTDPKMELPIQYSKTHHTVRRRAREEYVRRQNGLCLHCGEPLGQPPNQKVQDAYINGRLFPFGFFDHPIHLHHDRKTDLSLGAVHARCNAWLWQYKGE